MQIKNLWTGEHHHSVVTSRYNTSARSFMTEGVRNQRGLMSTAMQSGAEAEPLKQDLQRIEQVRIKASSHTRCLTERGAARQRACATSAAS